MIPELKPLLDLYESMPQPKQEENHKDKQVTRLFVKSVGDTQTFEMKDTGICAAIRQFFSRLVSPKTYNLEENLKKVQEQLCKIKPEQIDAEQVTKLNALTEKLETIRDQAIASLKKPTLFSNNARAQKAENLSKITFKKIQVPARTETPPAKTPADPQVQVDLSRRVDLVVGQVETLPSAPPEETPPKHALLAAEVDKACKELGANSFELLKVLEMATEEKQQLELPHMRAARVEALNVCLALAAQVQEDTTWPSEQTQQQVTAQLKSTMDRLLAESKLIDSCLSPNAPPTPAPTLANHNITKKLMNAAASITTRDIEQAAMIVFSAKTANLPSLALAIVAPYVVNLFVEKVSQKVLPNDMSPNAQHLASFVKTMSSALLLVYGIDYLSGPRAHTVATEPLHVPANNTLAQPVCDISQAPNATMTPVTPITYVGPLNPTTTTPANATASFVPDLPAQVPQPLDVPASNTLEQPVCDISQAPNATMTPVTYVGPLNPTTTTPADATASFMPDVPTQVPQPLPHTSQGWWGTIASVVHGVAEGFFDPIKNPALEALQIQGDK